MICSALFWRVGPIVALVATLSFVVDASATEFEVCDAPDLEIDPEIGPTSHTIEVDESVALVAPRIRVELETPWIGLWDLRVTSPTGTTVFLYNGLQRGADFDVTFLDSGQVVGVLYSDPRYSPPDYDGPSLFDCGGCPIRASGSLDALGGEDSAGEWTLAWDVVREGALREWCVGNDPVLAVGNANGSHWIDTDGDERIDTPGPLGVFSVYGVTRSEVDSIEVRVDGELLFSIPGPIAPSTIFYGDNEEAPLVGRQRVELGVVAIAGGDESVPVFVEIALPGAAPYEVEVELDRALALGRNTIPIAFPESAADVEVKDVRVDLVARAGSVARVEYYLRSSAGTEVVLTPSTPLGDRNASYSDYGLWYGRDANRDNVAGLGGCFCITQTSGPGELRDFAGETIGSDASGALSTEWELVAIRNFGLNSPTLDVAVSIFDSAPPYAPDIVECASVGLDVAEVAWVNEADYSGIVITVDGVDLVVDDGTLFDLAEGAENTTLLEGLTVPNTARIGVRGLAEGGVRGPAAHCKVRLELAPIRDLLCVSPTGTGTLEMTWVNADAYDEIDVRLNGVLVATLPGDETEFTIAEPQPFGVPVDVELIPRILACNPLGLPCEARAVAARALPLEPVDQLACATGIVVETDARASISLEVGEPATVEDIQVFQNSVGALGDFDFIDLTSPLGTTVRILARIPTTPAQAEQLVVWDDDAEFVLQRIADGVEIRSLSGALGVFHGEPATGEWRLSVGASGRVQIHEVCLRLEVCPALAPTDLSATAGASDPRSITVEWGEPSEYSEVEIFRNGELLASIDPGVETYIDEVAGSGRYRYQIRAWDTLGECELRSRTASALVGAVAACTGPFDFLSGFAEFSVPIFDPIQIASVEFSIDAFSSRSPQSIDIESPLGTSIGLWRGTIVNTERLGVVFSDEGDPFDLGAIMTVLTAPGPLSPSSSPLDGLLLAPSGPGTFDDFSSEIADGEWLIRYHVFIASTFMADACVTVFEGCEAPPPSGANGERLADDIEWTWSNNGEYSQIEVVLNGQSVAVLDGEAESYVQVAPEVGEHDLRLLVTESRGEECVSSSGQMSSTPFGVEAFCRELSPAIVIPSAALPAEDTLDVDISPPSVRAVHVGVNIFHPAVEELEVRLFGPDGTSVLLHDGGGGGRLDAIYSDSPGEVVFGDRLVKAPAEPAVDALAVFLDPYRSDALEGDWRIEVVDVVGGVNVGVLDSWCLYFEPGCPVTVPDDLACADTVGMAPLGLEWSNSGAYDAIDILRDGVLIATIDGTEETFLDASPDLRFGERYTYEVIAIRDDEECSAISRPCLVRLGEHALCDDAPPGTAVDLEIDWSPADGSTDATTIAEIAVYIDSDVFGPTSELRLQVTSPDGTNVVMMDGEEGAFLELRVWFDDNGDPIEEVDGETHAALVPAIFAPVESLDAFEGEIANGAWTVQAWEGFLVEACIGVSGFTADEPLFLRGDLDVSGALGIGDVIDLMEYAFIDGPVPACLRAADFDGDGVVSAVADSVASLAYQYVGGPAPPAPFPDCGVGLSLIPCETSCP